jgi:hypothetical protein
MPEAEPKRITSGTSLTIRSGLSPGAKVQEGSQHEFVEPFSTPSPQVSAHVLAGPPNAGKPWGLQGHDDTPTGPLGWRVLFREGGKGEREVPTR